MLFWRVYETTIYPLALSDSLNLIIPGRFFRGGSDADGSYLWGYLDFEKLLPLLPVPNLILPGLFLNIYMGLIPLLLVYGLLAKPNWFDFLFKWSGHHWAWTGSVIFSIGVGLWLAYEGLLVGWWPITTITAIQGGVILLLTLMPSLRRFYKI